MSMPNNQDRTPAGAVAEELADAYLKGAAKKPSLDDLDDAFRLTSERDMHDPIRSKLHKAIGLAYETSEPAALEKAKQHLAEAVRLNASGGAKRDLQRVEKLLAAQAKQNAEKNAQ